MWKLKNLLVIGGVAVIAVLGISITRAIAAPAPWEQSWPANTSQAQTTQASQQPSSALSPSTVAPSNDPGSKSASSSTAVSAATSSNLTQSTTPVKPNISSATTPATSTNQASSKQSVSPQTVKPTSGQVIPRNQSDSGYWCSPTGSDYHPSYSWYYNNQMSGWNNGSGASGKR